MAMAFPFSVETWLGGAGLDGGRSQGRDGFRSGMVRDQGQID